MFIPETNIFFLPSSSPLYTYLFHQKQIFTYIINFNFFMKVIKDEELESLAKASGENGKYLLVDVYADWCQPCRTVGSELTRLYNTDPFNKLDIVKLDAEDMDNQEFCIRNNVRNIPTLLLFKGDDTTKPIAQYTGTGAIASIKKFMLEEL